MLDRLFEDDYPNLEVIVIDGGSTDDTVNLLKSYGDKIARWVSEPDGGEYFAINKGVRLATGGIVKPIADDDVLRPGCFHLAACYFAEHPEVDILFGQAQIWQEIDGVPVPQNTTYYTDASNLKPERYFRTRPGLPSLASFVRSRVFEKIGLFATDFVIGDYEFWGRAVSRKVPIGLIPDVVVDYHYTGENGIFTKADRIRWDRVRIAHRYGTPSDLVFELRNAIVMEIKVKFGPFLHKLGIYPHTWRETRRLRRSHGR